MKRRRTIQLVRGVLLAVVLIAVLVDLAGEFGALTPWVAGRIRRELAAHGLVCHVGSARVGLVTGIRLDNLTVRDDGERAVRLLHIHRIKGTPAFAALFRGRLRLKQVAAENVTVFTPPDAETPATLPAASIDHVVASVHSDRIRIERVLGTVLQIPIHVEGTITGLAPGDGEDATGRSTDWSWASRTAAIGIDLPPPARALLSQLRANTFAEKDSGLYATFELPLDAPGSFRAQGRLAVADLILFDTPIRKLKGAVHLTPAAVSIPSCALFMDGDRTVLHGSLEFDRRTQRLAGRMDATVPFARARSMAGLSAAPILRDLSCPEPLAIHLSLAPSPLRVGALQGTLRATTAQLNGYGQPLGAVTMEGSFENGILSFPRLQISDDRRDALDGNLTVDTNDRTLSGTLSGALATGKLIKGTAMAAQAPPWLHFRDDAEADTFTVKAENSPWPADGLRLTGSAALHSLQLGELPISSTRFEFALNGSELTLEDFRMDRDGAEGQTATLAAGRARCDVVKRTLGASLEGRVAASQLGLLLQSSVPEAVRAAIGRTGHLSYALQLDESPLDWAQWVGTAELEATEMNLGGVSVHSIDIPISFSGEEIACDGLAVTLADEMTTTGSFSLRRPNLVLNAKLDAQLSSSKLVPLLPEPVASGKLSGLDVDRIDLTVETTDLSLKTPDWQVAGTLAAGPGKLENFVFESISESTFTLSRRQLPQPVVELRTHVPRADLGKHATIEDARVKITAGNGISVEMDGRAKATPEFVEAFIFGPRFQRMYGRIWTHFQWDAERPPQVHLKSLHFYDNRREDRWFLRMEADARIPHCRYRRIAAENLTGVVRLNLPGEVRLENLAAQTPGGRDAAGSVTFSLKNDPECRLQVKGATDPNSILASIINNWPETPPVHFTPPCLGSFSGTIPLDDPGAVTLRGAAEQIARLDLGPLPFQNVAGQWEWAENCLTIKEIDADLHGGRFAGNGKYCFTVRRGDLVFNAKDMQLQPLLAGFGGGGTVEQEGLLDISEADIGVYHTGENHELGLEGTAALKLRESSLWQIPIFSKLASLLRVSLVRKIVGLGDITQCSADLKLDGDTVRIRDFRTNGTVISLRGMAPGTYNWRTQALRLAVRGEILKKTVIVPLITTPLSWLFEAELRGTRAQPEWRLLNAVKEGIFGGQNAPEDE